MKKTQKYLGILCVAYLILVTVPTFLRSESLTLSPHGDRSKLPKGCNSCHKGHGILNTPMLSVDRDLFCFRCHGESANVEATRNEGDLAQNTKAANLQREFLKSYRHPVENKGIHKYGEIMPENDPSAQRHSECGDCHHYHYVQTDNKTAGIKGVNAQGLIIDRITFEYELCFKCHSYSANLPGNQRNLAEIFSVANPSYHPVISQGKNMDVPSLIPPLTTNDMIKCSACHNNDDPLGPRGPHASIYSMILAKNYTSTDGTEGPFQYELCYGCHRRESILGNESFIYHNLHIATVGTSCRTCHTPHGSTVYTHLMDFDNISITQSSGGRLEFIDLGSKAGECYLTCHGRDHNPSSYPVSQQMTDR